jgi:TolB-like protein
MNILGRLSVLFCVTLFLVSAASAQIKPTIAVLSLEAKNVNKETADAVADILSTELFNSQRFNVIERQAITRILEEQKLQMTGVTDMNQAVEIGKVLNVAKIMIGSVSRLGDTFIVNTRLVDVKTGALELAQNAKSTRGEEGLTSAISELVANISQKVTVEGSIIRINPNVLLIDLGQKHGLLDGQDLAVVRVGDVVTDLGGAIIGRSEDTIGSIRISSVKPEYSEATVVQSKTNFRVGDKVRMISGPIEIKQEQAKKPPKKSSDKKGAGEPPPAF